MDAVRMANTNFTFENFPDSASRRLPAVNAETISKYLQQAFSKREDYRAAQRRVEESRALLPVARSGLKPRLELNFDAGVSGLSEGAAPAQFVNSPYRSIQGLDAIAGIIFAFPVRNNFAVGQVRQAEATLAQAQLKVEDLRRGISSSVITALNAVCNTAAQVDRAREAVVSFQAALQGEREKFSLGFSSVVDVLTVEDRLTTAMTSQVNAELSYAIALTQLRSATGTIVESGKAGYSVTQDVFFSVP
jgi:outer membrane protein